MHTVSNFSPTEVSPKLSPPQDWAKIFCLGIDGKVVQEGEGLGSDEEKDAVNRSGVEVALGVYPHG